MVQAPEPSQRASEPAGPDEQRTSVLLAEYSALRAELDRRTGTQWNVVAIQVSTTSVILGFVLSNPSASALLLLLPLTSYVFGSRYILHDFHIKLIARYIRESLSGRLGGNLRWEGWKADATQGPGLGGNVPGVVRWSVLHPTRLVFEGVAGAAFLAAGLAGALAWSQASPSWPVAVGFSLLWILGLVALVALDASFRRSS